MDAGAVAMNTTEALARAMAMAEGLDPDAVGVLGEPARARVAGRVFAQGDIGPLWHLLVPAASRLIEVLASMDYVVHSTRWHGSRRRRRAS